MGPGIWCPPSSNQQREENCRSVSGTFPRRGLYVPSYSLSVPFYKLTKCSPSGVCSFSLYVYICTWRPKDSLGCWPQGLPTDLFFHFVSFLLLFFETGPLTGLELPREDKLAGQCPEESACFHLPITGLADTCPCWPALYRFCDWNSGPCACTTSALLTEPFPQSQLSVFKNLNSSISHGGLDRGNNSRKILTSVPAQCEADLVISMLLSRLAAALTSVSICVAGS